MKLTKNNISIGLNVLLSLVLVYWGFMSTSSTNTEQLDTCIVAATNPVLLPTYLPQSTITPRATSTPRPTVTIKPTVTKKPTLRPISTTTPNPNIQPTVTKRRTLPTNTATPDYNYFVTNRRIHVYSQPSAESTLIKTLGKGEGYQIIGRNQKDTWYKILAGGNGYWVIISAGNARIKGNRSDIPIITVVDSITMSIGQQKPKVTSNEGNVNLRLGPGVNYNVVGSLLKDESLEIIGSNNGWYQVKMSDGSKAWLAGFIVEVGNSNNIDIPVIDDIPPTNTPLPPTLTPLPTATIYVVPTNTPRPFYTPTPINGPPSGARSKCRDGTYSGSTGRGTCSRHGGVAERYGW